MKTLKMLGTFKRSQKVSSGLTKNTNGCSGEYCLGYQNATTVRKGCRDDENLKQEILVTSKSMLVTNLHYKKMKVGGFMVALHVKQMAIYQT